MANATEAGSGSRERSVSEELRRLAIQKKAEVERQRRSICSANTFSRNEHLILPDGPVLKRLWHRSRAKSSRWK